MSGETQVEPSSLTIDSLHTLIDAKLAEKEIRDQQRYEEQEAHARRALESTERLRAETVLRLEQRFNAQEEALKVALATVEKLRRELELRQEQRFNAQEEAVKVAVQAVDKEFHEHLNQYQMEIKSALHAVDQARAAALNATEKAIDKQEAATRLAIEKQEIATEKRFEGVNEFRAQLSDQAASFMPRKESEARHAQSADKLAALEKQILEQISSLRSRIDRNEASVKGEQITMGKLYAGLAAIATIIGLVVLIANGKL